MNDYEGNDSKSMLGILMVLATLAGCTICAVVSTCLSAWPGG